VIGGLDFGLGAAMVGITGGYEAADVRLNRITPNSRVETWFIGGYGTFGFGPAFVDLVGSYGKSDLDLRRNVSFADFSNASTSSADSRYYSLSATAGFSRDFGSFELEPYVGVRYADVRIDNFSEGAGLTNLSVGRQKVDSLQGVAGLRVGVDYPMGNVRIRPTARAEYRREFENDGPRLITSSFNGGGIGTPFTTTTTPLGDDQLVVGAGLTIAGEGPVSMAADYTGQFLGGYEIHGVQVGLRIKL
jgi:outer membrane autotransporter protein